MSTNVSSYNSAGCGGCGGNMYPALSRIFVNSIEPCTTDGTITLNLGQVEVAGQTDTTTITGKLQVNGVIETTQPFSVGNLTSDSLTVNGDITQSTGTASLKTVQANNISCDDIYPDNIYNNLEITTNTLTVQQTLTCQTNISQTGGATTLKGTTIDGNLSVSNTATLNIANVSGDLTVDTNVLKVKTDTNRVGINVVSPTEALDVSGNIKGSGTLTGTYISPLGQSYHQAIIRNMSATPDSVTNNATYTLKNWTSGTDYNSPVYSFNAATGLFTNTGTTRLVMVRFNVGFSANATGRRQVEILVDSTVYGRTTVNSQSGTTSTYMNNSAIVLWPANSTIGITAFQDSGAALSVTTVSTYVSILFL